MKIDEGYYCTCKSTVTVRTKTYSKDWVYHITSVTAEGECVYCGYYARYITDTKEINVVRNFKKPYKTKGVHDEYRD